MVWEYSKENEACIVNMVGPVFVPLVLEPYVRTTLYRPPTLKGVIIMFWSN